MDTDVEELEAQLEWYADQAQENEAVARQLDRVCERALARLDEFFEATTFEDGMRRLIAARRMLRQRHTRVAYAGKTE